VASNLFKMNYSIIIFFALLIIVLLSGFSMQKIIKNNDNQNASSNFYDLQATSLDGQLIDFNTFKGKKVLIVNVASRCGYTYQYEGLQKLYEIYGDKLVIIGFPANDFLFQESGSNEQIAEFCETNYGVTFPMSEKITTKGKKQSPVYQWLTNSKLNGWNNQKPTWNFCKYLIDEKGNLTAFFDSKIKPMSEDITKLL
jgi:glutathione peroxidase